MQTREAHSSRERGWGGVWNEMRNEQSVERRRFYEKDHEILKIPSDGDPSSLNAATERSSESSVLQLCQTKSSVFARREQREESNRTRISDIRGDGLAGTLSSDADLSSAVALSTVSSVSSRIHRDDVGGIGVDGSTLQHNKLDVVQEARREGDEQHQRFRSGSSRSHLRSIGHRTELEQREQERLTSAQAPCRWP